MKRFSLFLLAFALSLLCLSTIDVSPVVADSVTYYSADATISATPIRVKQIEFSCEADAACFAFVRYGTTSTTASFPADATQYTVGFALQATAGASRTYNFWEVGKATARYPRQVGILAPEAYYDEVTGKTHSIFVTDKP